MGKKITGEELKATLLQMSKQAASLKWYSMVRPFDQIAPLRDRVGDLETVVMRLGNLIARADGAIKKVEQGRIKMIQDELYLHLRKIPIDEPQEHATEESARRETIENLSKEAEKLLHAPAGRVATQLSKKWSRQRRFLLKQIAVAKKPK